VVRVRGRGSGVCGEWDGGRGGRAEEYSCRGLGVGVRGLVDCRAVVVNV
jgi:hypothetical protein